MGSADQPDAAVTYRPGTPADSRAAYTVLAESYADLVSRLDPQHKPDPAGDTPEAREADWQKFRPLFEHLAHSAEHFWLAERGDAVVGYARSTLRDGLRELTELFVVPHMQTGGVGRELLKRAFPAAGVRWRAVIAAPNPTAQVLYLRSGVYPRFPIAYFAREPEAVELVDDLEFRPLEAGAAALATLAEIDADVLGFRRDRDHRWLLTTRHGVLVLRQGRPAGYGYVGAPGGPWALRDPADFPSVLAFAERVAARQGTIFGVQVPLINRHAVDYLLGRGCRMRPHTAQFMADQPFGRFEHYVSMNPMFFI